MAIPIKMLVYPHTKQLFVHGLFYFSASQWKVRRFVQKKSFCLVPRSSCFVFFAFGTILFSENQWFTLLRLPWSPCWICIGLELAIHNVVSSALISTLQSGIASGRSLICNKKRMGPKIEPCGTPWVIGSVSDNDPLIQHCCVWSCR